MIGKMSKKSTLSREQLARFLLSLECLLLPSQGAEIAEELKRSPYWGQSNGESREHRGTFHFIIANFLSYPSKFVDIPYLQLLPYWDDDSSGCVWGIATWKQEEKGLKSYTATLQQRFDAKLEHIKVRRCIGPFLTGTVPQNGVVGQTPSLPVNVAKYILDHMLGGINDTPIEQNQIHWLSERYGKTGLF